MEKETFNINLNFENNETEVEKVSRKEKVVDALVEKIIELTNTKTIPGDDRIASLPEIVKALVELVETMNF